VNEEMAEYQEADEKNQEVDRRDRMLQAHRNERFVIVREEQVGG